MPGVVGPRGGDLGNARAPNYLHWPESGDSRQHVNLLLEFHRFGRDPTARTRPSWLLVPHTEKTEYCTSP